MVVIGTETVETVEQGGVAGKLAGNADAGQYLDHGFRSGVFDW